MIGFQNYKELTLAMAAVRPDYLLFKDTLIGLKPKEKYQYVQFTQGFTVLPLIQSYKNSFTGVKNTIIVDKNLWDISDAGLISVLERIIKIQRVGFQYPVKIKRIIENEKIKELFLQINFSLSYKSVFVNNYGNNVDSIKKIIDFLAIFPSYKYFKPFKIQAITKVHLNNLDARLDLFRDLEIMDYTKMKNVRLNMTCPRVKKTDYWDYFLSIKQWSNNGGELSYIEFMGEFSVLRSQKEMEEIINNRIEWRSYRLRELIYLIQNYYEEIEPWIYRKSGNKMLNININLNYIRKEW